MKREHKIYKWAPKDKWLYVLSMIPFAVAFVGTAYLLATYSVHVAIIFVALYIIINIFQAWYLVPIYFGLIVAHFILFMPTQCEKCSYNATCPGGQTWQKCCRQLGIGNVADDI